MPLIENLEIENYRCFQKLSVKGLSRVNLIVGANNSGKTALLEAIEWHAARASPRRLWMSLKRRSAYVDEVIADETDVLDVRTLFYGRVVDHPDNRGNTGRKIRVSSHEGGDSVAKYVIGGNAKRAGLALSCSRGTTEQPMMMLTDERGISAKDRSEIRSSRRPKLVDPVNVNFIPTGLQTAHSIGEIWQKIAATADEDRLNQCAALADNRIERVVVGSTDLSKTGFGGIYVRLKGQQDRVSLSELGDGIRRLVGLSASLGVSHGGVLLIDELDNGLYYGMLPQLWTFLVKASRLLDVQIFATTHSRDCLHGIAELHREDPELAKDVTVHRVESGRDSTVRMDAETIEVADEGNQEVR